MSETAPPGSATGIALGQASHRNRVSCWLGMIGLCLLFAALRWNNLNAPLIRDEGEYAYAAQLLTHGQLPYEHSFLQKPPMVAYSYALAHLLLPNEFWSPRVLAGLFVAATTALLGYIARREFGPGLALPVMWLATPMLLLPGIDQFAANTESFMLLPLLATVATYVHSRAHGSSLTHWFIAGFLGVTALCYKQTAFPLLGFVYIVWSVESWRKAPALSALLKNWLACTFGGIMAGLLELGPFLLHDHGAHLWECTVLFNCYYVVHNFGWDNFWWHFSEFFTAWWMLFFVPLAVLIQPPPRIRFWTTMFLLGWLSTSGSPYGHYYLVIMPFWALLTAAGIDTLATAVQQRRSRPVPWLKTALTGAVVILVLIPDLPWMMRSPAQFAVDRLYGINPFLESPTVAKRVAELSSPGDYVLVAGSEPQILVYANRTSPTRFVIVYPLMIDTPLAEGFQSEAVRELQQHQPRLIVLVRSPTSWLQGPKSPPEFIGYLKTLLSTDYEMKGGYVRQGTGGHWQEPLSEADSTSCILVVYQRKTPLPGAAL